jgi:dTDP-4-amino-4,6-dideoxygalactose transaminase
MSVIHVSDPRSDYTASRREIDEAVLRVLSSGSYVIGDEVKKFEAEFSSYLGVHHVISVASGTDALHLALRACGVGTGDGVVTVSHTAVATVAAIELAGAGPVLIDVDAETMTMSEGALEQVIQAPPNRLHIKAIIAVHLYGYPMQMQPVMELAHRHGLQVIEDCAQSHGASIGNRKTGTWGHLGAFSFYPTKNLGAMGDAGTVVTDDAMLAERLRGLREYGWTERYVSSIPGTNSRLDEIQAAILNVKLPRLDQANRRRGDIARKYREGLAGTGLVLPLTPEGGDHVFHQYVVRTSHRDEFRQHLADRGVQTSVHYPVPIHLQPAYRDRIAKGSDLSVTEAICSEIVSLPMHPYLSDEQVEQVIEVIQQWCCR